jgi:hypothetical protein
VISTIRGYWRDGRGVALFDYAALAFGIAILEFAVAPEHLAVWSLWYNNFPSRYQYNPLLGIIWPALIAVLTICWIVVVVKAFKKCGRPAIILLLSIPWGLRVLMSLDYLSAVCLFWYPDCI